MDLYPKNFKEQLDEAYEFMKALKNKGLWDSDWTIWTDEHGNLCAGQKNKNEFLRGIKQEF